MVEIVTEKPVCGKCGFDVRAGTTYCYNCGARVITESEVADDPEKTLIVQPNGNSASAEKQVDKPPDQKDRVSRAAKERKKARVTSRTPVEYRWEPSYDLGFTLAWAIILTAVVAVIAGLMVFWK